MRDLPGVAEVLRANPTLTDLSWLGDRVGLHFCDGQSILEVDPAELRPLQLPMLGKFSLEQQGLAIAAAHGAEDAGLRHDRRREPRPGRAAAGAALAQVVLKGANLGGVTVTSDAYRLPDYKKHPLYVFSVQVVCRQAAAARGPGGRPVGGGHQAGGAAAGDRRQHGRGGAAPPTTAHLLVRLNRQALSRRVRRRPVVLGGEGPHWPAIATSARSTTCTSSTACRWTQVPRLSEAKYGVRYFCPDDGQYRFDAERNQVVCSVHGNREQSRQKPLPDRKTSFSRFIESVDEVTASLRFEDDALLATIEIVRGGEGKKE